MNGLQMMRRVYMSETVKRLDDKSIKLLDEIFDLLYQIEGNDDDGRSVWLTVARGSFEEYMKDNPDEEYIKDEKMFNEEYPEVFWIPVYAIRNERVRFLRVLSLDFEVRDEDLNEEYRENFSFILKPIKKEIEKAIKNIKNNIYNGYVEKNLPYELRFGFIKRKEFWAVDTEDKKRHIGKLTDSEINELVDILQKEKKDVIPENLIPEMTFNKYFEMAAACYKAVGFEMPKSKSLSDYFFAHGEDFGSGVLFDLDYDSVKDFEDYFEDRLGNMGGHPWGILRGSSRSRIMLYPKKTDNGYYFRFSADPNWSAFELVKFYLTLKKKGCPVVFTCPQESIDYFKEEDFVGFVSEYRLAVYCQDHFKEGVNDFRHFDAKLHGCLMGKIKWNETQKLYLKNK